MAASIETAAGAKVEKEEEKEEVLCSIPPQEHFLSTPPHGDATAVHIYNITAPETVVMLHGCGGYKQDWQTGKISPRLATRYRVVMFDWYGHGDSADLPGDEYTTQVYL